MTAESAVLAAASAVLGLAFAAATLRLMPGISAIGLPAFVDLRLNGGAVLFATAVALLSTFATTLAPALRTGRSNLHDVLVAG